MHISKLQKAALWALVGMVLIAWIVSAFMGYTHGVYEQRYETMVKDTICATVHESAIKGIECDGK